MRFRERRLVLFAGAREHRLSRLVLQPSGLAPANPKNTTTARFKRTISSSSRRPIFLPILGLGDLSPDFEVDLELD